MRKLALITLALTASLLLSGASAKAQVRTIKLAYLPITHSIPLFILKDDVDSNSSSKIAIELIKYGTWPELVDALVTNRVDGATMFIEFAMKAKEEGIDLKAVSLAHRDGATMIVSKDVGSIADLKGKTVAIPEPFSTMNILLHLALQKAGISYSDLNIVVLPPPEMPVALFEKRVAGYIVADPFAAISIVNGNGKILFTADEIWKNSVCCGLVLHNNFITGDNEAAKELFKGYRAAGAAADLKNERVFELASKYMTANQEIIKISLDTISYSDLDLRREDYDQLVKYLADYDLLEKSPSYEDFVENGLK
ncbi:MAG: ABC transporter substrate-binding protein [Deltaproteobacteria bacterium]|nr:ABC transporter substrate-binding protein [Deltaproteobacteria bacterium]